MRSAGGTTGRKGPWCRAGSACRPIDAADKVLACSGATASPPARPLRRHPLAPLRPAGLARRLADAGHVQAEAGQQLAALAVLDKAVRDTQPDDVLRGQARGVGRLQERAAES